MSVQPEFDELIHFPTRFRICAALEATAALEFAVLEEGLGISTSLLSKQLRVLVDAGYLVLEKRSTPGLRPRTWAKLTPAGRGAYQAHTAALRAILDGHALH